MAIEYRKLTEKDLTTFIELRIGQLREEGAKEDFDLRPNLLDYYKRHMADGTFVSWLAVDSDPCCKRGKSLRLRLCPDYCTEMGVLLYTNFGFVKNGNFMQYAII